MNTKDARCIIISINEEIDETEVGADALREAKEIINQKN